MGIEGKVAKILNSREVVINKGASDGVRIGMKFNIQEHGINIIDPDSKEQLGCLTRSKITVEAVDVKPRFSIARTFEPYQEMIDLVSNSPYVEPRYVTRVKKIQDSAGDDSREGFVSVSVGDAVIQLQQVGQVN